MILAADYRNIAGLIPAVPTFFTTTILPKQTRTREICEGKRMLKSPFFCLQKTHLVFCPLERFARPRLPTYFGLFAEKFFRDNSIGKSAVIVTASLPEKY